MYTFVSRINAKGAVYFRIIGEIKEKSTDFFSNLKYGIADEWWQPGDVE